LKIDMEMLREVLKIVTHCRNTLAGCFMDWHFRLRKKKGRRGSLVPANQKERKHLTDEYLRRKKYFAGPLNLDFAQPTIVVDSDLSSIRSTMMKIDAGK
jgi:hypothetical protein